MTCECQLTCLNVRFLWHISCPIFLYSYILSTVEPTKRVYFFSNNFLIFLCFLYLQKGLKNVFDEAILAALEPPEQKPRRKCCLLWFGIDKISYFIIIVSKKRKKIRNFAISHTGSHKIFLLNFKKKRKLIFYRARFVPWSKNVLSRRNYKPDNLRKWLLGFFLSNQNTFG